MLSVQDVSEQKKDKRIMIRTYSSVPTLLKQLASQNNLTESDIINKLILHALSKKGFLTGRLEKHTIANWTGSIEDMPLHL